MEDVLEVYQLGYGDNEVLVCLDETSKQQVSETRQPRPSRPGAARAYDYEYQRNGVSNLFMVFAPLEGWRRVEVTDRRTKVDWARVVRKLVDEDYPDKDRIVLVIHYTPKHGSWLNMAEIELGVLARQCLDRRIPDEEVLAHETEAWQDRRNRDTIRVDWRFTTEDARIKLKSLYTSIQRCWTTSVCLQIPSFPHLNRHSRENGNPVAEVVNHGSDPFIIRALDSCFRRSDGLFC